MPQVQLPLFPVGVTFINDALACQCQDGQVVYLNGHLPVFTHTREDLASFRFFTTQLIVNGSATQGEIARAFGVPIITVKRCVKRQRTRGAAAFFTPAPRREGSRLNAGVLAVAQGLLAQGLSVPEVSRQTGVLASTLHKAIRAGRLPRPAKKVSAAEPLAEPTTLSQRSALDAQTPLGYATTRTLERVAASVGLLEAAPLEFERADDVPHGGVLLALPALLAQGLLRHARTHYELPAGFYPLETIFLVLALLALARCPSLEQARYTAPGEWGRLLGLDRIPEVKTLREKLAVLCAEPGRATRWSTQLAQEWMAATAPESTGIFYADGHVRVYHGGLTELPRRYVARQRLCLRGTTDYWVNAFDGQPFFVVTAPVNPGLVAVLRERIVPRLLAEVPNQPAAADLAAGHSLVRFTLVFDREGYSPDLFAELAALRIAILTYHKFPGDDWSAAEFAPHRVILANGEVVAMDLAERGTRLSNGLWVREVRRASGDHQVSVLSTDWRVDLCVLAPRLMARWCQENFLKYMREHYGLDRLIEYGTTPLPETTTVVNPAWRQADQAVRRQRAAVTRLAAAFGAANLPAAPEHAEMDRFEREKGQLQAELQSAQATLDGLKSKRTAHARHVELRALPAEQRFTQLRPEKKHFVDTIKLIAYRAETAMSGLVREKLARSDDARALLRKLYVTAADLIPDPAAKTLTVRLHHQAAALQDAAVAHLCAELNATETIFPGTDLRLIYELPGSG